jgi:hypothetical protein
MKWIDHPNYFGPDRRRAWFGVCVIDRRLDDFTGPPPPLSRAMRQLRQYVLDAHGERLDIFITRVESTALLARVDNEPETSAALLRLAAVAYLGKYRDVRPDLIDMLDRAHAALRTPDTTELPEPMKIAL